KRFTLDDNHAKRFRRWKSRNPGLELEAFKVFLASGNTALSPEEQKAMWNKYEKEVQKSKK
ncbi:TPA: type III restriction endonuclease subunit R, partial [Escherichia coli]|nr:type III restriction endonuclease subunit R [Escherichia coli]